jgi:hypothetical protein
LGCPRFRDTLSYVTGCRRFVTTPRNVTKSCNVTKRRNAAIPILRKNEPKGLEWAPDSAPGWTFSVKTVAGGAFREVLLLIRRDGRADTWRCCRPRSPGLRQPVPPEFGRRTAQAGAAPWASPSGRPTGVLLRARGSDPHPAAAPACLLFPLTLEKRLL